MNILITGAGGAAAISVWKSLAAKHTVYMADIDPCAAGLYLVPAARRLLIPRGDAADFAPQVLAQCQQHNIELLIPTVDVELIPLAKRSAEFTSLGIQMPLSPLSALEMCRDKYALLNVCQDTGHTPRFELLTANTDSAQLVYPLFAKPRTGAGSAGAQIIHSPNELALLPIDGSYLIQELLPGEEYSVDVYIHSSGTPRAAVPRLRMKIDSGIAVAAQTHINPMLASMALTIAEKAGITYVANVQFKANRQGEFKLLEINPRFPGTLPLTAAAGIDIPALLIDDLERKPFEQGLLAFKELMVVRYWTEQFCSIEEWNALCIS